MIDPYFNHSLSNLTFCWFLNDRYNQNLKESAADLIKLSCQYLKCKTEKHNVLSTIFNCLFFVDVFPLWSRFWLFLFFSFLLSFKNAKCTTHEHSVITRVGLNLNVEFESAHEILVNLNSTFAKSINLNLVFSKSMNLNH